MSNTDSTKSQIAKLLFVVFFGVILALTVTVWMAYRYGPSGKYLAQNVLLSPETLQQLNYNAYNPKTNGQSRFIFDNVQFSTFDPEKREWVHKTVHIEQYAKFYQLIQGEKSLLDPSEPVSNEFNNPYSKLLISVKTESSAGWQATVKPFEEVQFLNDMYRVELHIEGSTEQWAYFQHPDINKLAREIFK